MFKTIYTLMLCAGALCIGQACYASHDPYQLSEHFHKREFNHKQPGTELALDEFEIDPLLIRKLEELRTAIGDRPIIITSGYRSPEYNESVGGAKHSQHMIGRAADIRVAGMRPRTLGKYAQNVGFTFVKIYRTHVHVDVRR